MASIRYWSAISRSGAARRIDGGQTKTLDHHHRGGLGVRIMVDLVGVSRLPVWTVILLYSGSGIGVRRETCRFAKPQAAPEYRGEGEITQEK
jgi:hypothetical protein